jgi:hypothetical protein
VLVPGRQIVEERRAGPRRSSRQAALAGKKAAAIERYTSVPLRVKVVQLLASNYRDALLMDLTAGVPDAVADEFEGDADDDETDEEVDLLVRRRRRRRRRRGRRRRRSERAVLSPAVAV